MHDPMENGPEPELPTLRAMVLLSTFSAAIEVWHRARERAAGRDPSAQEAEAFVRPYLWQASGDLEALVMPWQASLAYSEGVEAASAEAVVRRFEDLLTLHRVARLLQVVHQRLLSLYPAVSEAVAEEARRLFGEAARLAAVEGDAFAAEGLLFIQRALRFAARMRQELSTVL